MEKVIMCPELEESDIKGEYIEIWRPIKVNNFKSTEDIVGGYRNGNGRKQSNTDSHL